MLFGKWDAVKNKNGRLLNYDILTQLEEKSMLMLFPILFLVFAAVSLAYIFKFTDILYKRNKRNNLSPETMSSYIQNLYDAIKDKKMQSAYISFRILAPLFDKKDVFFNIGVGGCSTPYNIFKVLLWSDVAYGIDWEKLKVEFIAILTNFRSFDSTKRTLSLEQIDDMINNLR